MSNSAQVCLAWIVQSPEHCNYCYLVQPHIYSRFCNYQSEVSQHISHPGADIMTIRRNQVQNAKKNDFVTQEVQRKTISSSAAASWYGDVRH